MLTVAPLLCLGLCLGLCTAFPGTAPALTPDAIMQRHLLRLASRKPYRAANTTTAGSDSAVHARPTEALRQSLWLRYTHPRLISVEPAHGKEKVVRGTLQQPLDHTDVDSTNPARWTQVYWRNSDSYATGGPAFVMISGTVGYDTDWLREGQMADLARKFNADRFFLTTRFFDLDNYPTKDTSAQNLKFLTVEQILMDVEAFLEHLLNNGYLKKDQKVILFGAGFGGAIATWARQGFPSMVHGVVASSPTLEAKYDTSSYFPVVTDAVNWYHRKDYNCEKFQRQAFQALNSALSTVEGRRTFNSYFQPCTALPEDASVSAEDRAQVLGLVASAVADLVQDDMDGPNERFFPGGDKLWVYCGLLAESREPPLVTLGRYISTTYYGRCLETSFQTTVKALSSTNWAEEPNQLGVRQWLWLQCTQLGQLPTTVSSTTTFPYSTAIDMDFYRKLCDTAFGESVSSSLVSNIREQNNRFGGKTPQISNAIFVKGDLDPWKGLAPADDLSGNEVHVFSVKRASHAHDMFPRDEYDPPWMKKTRKAIASILARWLSSA